MKFQGHNVPGVYAFADVPTSSGIVGGVIFSTTALCAIRTSIQIDKYSLFAFWNLLGLEISDDLHEALHSEFGAGCGSLASE